MEKQTEENCFERVEERLTAADQVLTVGSGRALGLESEKPVRTRGPAPALFSRGVDIVEGGVSPLF